MIASILSLVLTAALPAASGRLLVADSLEGALFVVDAERLEVEVRVEAVRGARDLALSDDASTVAVIGGASSAVCLIDTATWTRRGDPVRLAAEEESTSRERRYFPTAVVFWNGVFWVACGMRDTLVAVDPRTGQILERRRLVPTGDGSVWPARLAISGDRLLCSCFGNGRVAVFEATGEVRWSEVLASTLWGLAAVGTEEVVIATLDDRAVSLFGARDFELRGRVEIGGGPALVRSLASGEVVVTQQGEGAVVVVAFGREDPVAREELSGPPKGLALDGASGVLYVSIGKTARITAFSTPDLSVVNTARIGRQPMGLLFVPTVNK